MGCIEQSSWASQLKSAVEKQPFGGKANISLSATCHNLCRDWQQKPQTLSPNLGIMAQPNAAVASGFSEKEEAGVIGVMTAFGIGGTRASAWPHPQAAVAPASPLGQG